MYKNLAGNRKEFSFQTTTKMFATLFLLSIILSPAMLRSSLDYYNSNFGAFPKPEVIDNRAKINIATGYQYPKPEIPVNFDEPTPSAPIAPPSTYLPPLPENEPPIYDQFSPLPPQNSYLPYIQLEKLDVGSNINIKIVNMSCIDSPSLKFFRATVQTENFLNFPPIVEGATGDCVAGSGNTFNLNFDAGKLQQCGIRRCGNGNLCVKLRIATVRGLRLADDVGVVLLCKPQEAVASHVSSMKFNPRIVQGRALSPVASGGAQRKFSTDVALYRRTAGIGDFTERVIPSSSVQLGEDLLLRAVVREGDGWEFSRMGTVIMQRPSSLSTSPENSVILVDETGCRPQSIKSICPEHPSQVSPLVSVLPFKAFMFQEANPGEEVILSVRMYGCVQFEDCVQRAANCDEEKVQQRQFSGRLKRETKNGTRSGSVSDWRSYLEFRVVLPEENRATENATNDDKSGGASPSESRILTDPLTTAACFTGVFCASVFAVTVVVLVIINKKVKSARNN